MNSSGKTQQPKLTLCFGNHADTYFFTYGRKCYSNNIPPALSHLVSPDFDELASIVASVKTALISPFPSGNGGVYAEYYSTADKQSRCIITTIIKIAYPKLYEIIEASSEAAAESIHCEGSPDEYTIRVMKTKGLVLIFGPQEGQFLVRPSVGEGGAGVGGNQLPTSLKNAVHENLPTRITSEGSLVRCTLGVGDDSS